MSAVSGELTLVATAGISTLILAALFLINVAVLEFSVAWLSSKGLLSSSVKRLVELTFFLIAILEGMLVVAYTSAHVWESRPELYRSAAPANPAVSAARAGR